MKSRFGRQLLWRSSMAASLAAFEAGAQNPQYPPASPTYPPATTPPGSPAPLTTGGLTPPPTSEPRPGESETLYALEQAEKEDSGRGLEFVWLNAEAGYEYLALQSFQSNDIVDARVVADEGSAFVAGVGAGVRLVFITLGARFRLAQLSDWDLWTLNGEVGLHVPLGVLEPSFTFSAGYASLGAVDLDASAQSIEGDGPGASGFDVRLGAALDWYINPLLSLGAHSSFELLALYRNASAITPGDDPELAEIYARDGDGIGLGVTVTAVAGLHF